MAYIHMRHFTKKMLNAIKERHKPIANFLASGEGIRLQREDSDIAVEIIAQHIKINVPILTVHDSFIVPKFFEPFTIDIMNQVYGKYVSKYLGVSYVTTIDEIHWYEGLTKQDTTNNMNVIGLIKQAYNEEELNETYNRLNARVTTNQLMRQYNWRNNKYQYNKLGREVG